MSSQTGSNGTITITEAEYRALLAASAKLAALEAAGVDNWEWYGDAMSTLEEEEEDDY